MQYANLLELQYKLGNKLAGADWLEDSTRVDTQEALLREVVELSNSSGWAPWWSKGEAQVDQENCKLEVIDILHFFMQNVLQYAYQSRVQDFEQSEVKDDPIPGTEEFMNLIFSSIGEVMDEASQIADDLSVQEFDAVAARQSAKLFLGDFLCMGPVTAIAGFFHMAGSFGLDGNAIYAYYMAKNALNQFRKANNYKGDIVGAAPYIKIWNDGREDNAHVLDFLLENPQPTIEDAIEQIGILYSQRADL